MVVESTIPYLARIKWSNPEVPTFLGLHSRQVGELAVWTIKIEMAEVLRTLFKDVVMRARDQPEDVYNQMLGKVWNSYYRAITCVLKKLLNSGNDHLHAHVPYDRNHLFLQETIFTRKIGK